MQFVRRKLKIFFKTLLLFLCRLFTLFKEASPAILMYHSFDNTGWRYGTTPDQLEKQLDYLIENKKIVSLEEIVDFAKGEKEIPKNSVCITIDDGYEDTYNVFFPLAKKYQIPFALFLTTDLSEKPNLGNLKRPTWKQLKEMNDSGLMTIGLHGHTHMHFTKVLVQGLQKEEIENSLSIIRERFGVPVFFAAYPSGRYNQSVIDCLISIGQIKAVLSTHSGFIEKGDDLFKMKRIEVGRRIGFFMFKLRLTPAILLYNRLVAKLK